ncbi:putative dolichyl pyrophosphate Glc1Man9GlcNAc2 alpha-1 [Abeliophyllum distichum]|uniref:Dolichyl pyrophosphate Glc1Man9GlcNAc2 alpha-1 n=1 Tax=Abeliophyllum distichum TaxID=126358 RepID=A0ABD1RSG4_9LAMI
MWFGFSSHFSESKAGKASSLVLGKDDKLRSPNANRDVKFVFGWYGKAYLLGLFVVEIWGQFLHPIIFGNRLPFLSLMMISIYCAIEMTYSWIWQLGYIVKSR